MKILIILLITLLGTSLSDTLKVTQLEGNIILNDSTKLQLGDTIDEKDKIYIFGKSSLTVKDKHNKSLVIKRSGNYSGYKIKSKLRLSSINVSSKLANSLLNELASSDDLLSNTDINSNMNTLGAVERTIYTKNNDIVFMPRNSYVMDNVTFRWTDDNSELYVFSLKNTIGNILYSIITSETELKMNISNLLPNTEEYFFWDVRSDNGVSEEYCLYRYSEEDIKKIKQEETDLIKQLDLIDPIDNLILAKFYEGYRLNSQSNSYYERCIVMNPDIDEHLRLYYVFLRDNGLKVMPIYRFN